MSDTEALESKLAKFGVLNNGCLVFFMQVGFIVLEVGIGRAKNVRNILIKNMFNVMVTGVLWWAYGYALAYGDSAHGLVGHTMFFYEPPLEENEARPWFFSWTFLLAANTIPSGCLAERTALGSYLAYTVAMATVTHPLAAHWAWSTSSWLRNLTDTTFLDFAGGAAVHVVGGVTGLVGAALCGPRIGRFDDGRQSRIPGHDMAFVAIGTLMLWYGWYGFNCGSSYLYTVTSATARRVAVNTTLSASGGGIAQLLSSMAMSGSYELFGCCNGVLCGLVVITPLCGFVDPWAALISGAVAGLLYMPLSMTLSHLGVDDPLDSSVVHLGSGSLGVLLAGVLAKPQYVAQLYKTHRGGGLVYSEWGWRQLGVQLIGLLAIGGLAAVVALVLFHILKATGRLRVDQAVELAGIDMCEHGGPAYPEMEMIAGRRQRP